MTTDPLTRSLALDLERRGFVVFCAVPPASDSLIEQEGKQDLRALPLDIPEVCLAWPILLTLDRELPTLP